MCPLQERRKEIFRFKQKFNFGAVLRIRILKGSKIICQIRIRIQPLLFTENCHQNLKKNVIVGAVRPALFLHFQHV